MPVAVGPHEEEQETGEEVQDEVVPDLHASHQLLAFFLRLAVLGDVLTWEGEEGPL